MAINDQGTLLYHSATGAAASFAKLISITDAPAMGSAPGKLETTVLDSTVKTYIADRLDIPDLEFSYNYTAADFATVEAIASGATAHFLVIYSDGSGAKITGQARTWIDAVSRGSVVMAKLHIVASAINPQTVVETSALKSV